MGVRISPSYGWNVLLDPIPFAHLNRSAKDFARLPELKAQGMVSRREAQSGIARYDGAPASLAVDRANVSNSTPDRRSLRPQVPG